MKSLTIFFIIYSIKNSYTTKFINISQFLIFKYFTNLLFLFLQLNHLFQISLSVDTTHLKLCASQSIHETGSHLYQLHVLPQISAISCIKICIGDKSENSNCEYIEYFLLPRVILPDLTHSVCVEECSTCKYHT
jgi:hypothetical protein